MTAQTSEAVYTSDPGTLGYGGPISGFAQQGNAYGANKSDPHNLVHVMVGGDSSPDPQGWMWTRTSPPWTRSSGSITATWTGCGRPG